MIGSSSRKASAVGTVFPWIQTLPVSSALRCALVMPCLWVLAGCVSYYPRIPGTALVVDAETGQPLEDVVAAATWAPNDFLSTKSDSNHITLMTDAVTNASGRFSAPTAGAIEQARRLTALSEGRVRYAEPSLHLFKTGYRYTIIDAAQAQQSGYKGFHLNTFPSTAPWWDGRVFWLRRSGGPEDVLKRLASQMLPLDHCRWVEIPHLAAAYIREMERLEGLLAATSAATVSKLLQESCPDAQRPLADYLRVE